MKKSKLLSILLTMTLAVTMIFTGTESIFAGSVSDDTGVVRTIEAQDYNDIKSGTELKEYTATMISQESDNVTIIPVEANEKGLLKVSLTGIAVGNDVTVSLHSDASATKGSRIGSEEMLTSSYPDDEIIEKVPRAGTYYLKFSTYVSPYNAPEKQTVLFSTVLYPAGGTPVKGEVFYGSSPSDGVSYYKVTAPGTGYLTVSFSKNEDIYTKFEVKLLDSEKEPLFDDYEYLGVYRDDITHIGVKKGTYYIEVKYFDAFYGAPDDFYGIKINFKGVKENSGSSKRKAKTISKGSTKKGIITAAQSKNSADWYKFKLTRKQYVKFNVSTLTSEGGDYGAIKISFYKAGRKGSFGAKSFNPSDPSDTLQPYYAGYNTKLEAGTYYIKVEKYGNGNGYYKIKRRY